MTAILDFIAARTDEDEARARAAFSPFALRTPGADTWEFELMQIRARDAHRSLIVTHTWPHEGAHIAANDPANTQRRCAGVRRAVDAEIANLSVMDGAGGDGCNPNEIRAGRCGYPETDPNRSDVLRALASFWSTHPDYRQEWNA